MTRIFLDLTDEQAEHISEQIANGRAPIVPTPGGYVYDPTLSRTENLRAFEAAGRPTLDALGRALNMMGQPIVEQTSWYLPK
jgi:hypothetical protein